MTAEQELETALQSLWPSVTDAALRALLPHDLESLNNFYPRLQQYVADAPRQLEGTVDTAAIVRGSIISMGPGSAIEAGAIIDKSCRLILGARSIVRAGSLLRDEVVVGDDCLIGAHCDVTRGLLLGPDTALGHSIVFNDSIAGAGALLSAFIGTANTHLRKGKAISIRTRSGAVATTRTYLGALLGDGARIGSSATISPGTIVLPDLALPPGAALLGIIDAPRRQQLMTEYFARTDPRP
ncbi:MAG TPA: hypothetical protein VF846_13005 [Thermoanaerobaculia bacterium]